MAIRDDKAVTRLGLLAGYFLAAICAIGVLLTVGLGCVLEPAGAKDERARLAGAAAETVKGGSYEHPFEQRSLPELTTQPDWQDVLQRAFLANGELESAFFEWQATVARIQIASAWPNTNVQLGFDYMFSKGSMKGWDRTTLNAGFDPSMMLQFPAKVSQAGRASLADAQARGQRFRAAKFAIQQKVLSAWFDYCLAAEKIRAAEQNVALLKMVLDTATQRVRVGGPQQDLLKAQISHDLANNELDNRRQELSSMRVMLNGTLARPPQAPLAPPADLPPPRSLPADDARLLAVAVERNPELAALAREVAGRAEALELARMAYIPDIAPVVSITGGVSQAVGAMVSLPTTIPKIEGAIKEAQSMLRASEAMARQARADRGASFVATLLALRNSERQVALFRDSILPQARQVLASSRQAYASGNLAFADLIDSQRTLLDVQLMVAEARMIREKRLAELEALAGVDVETLGSASTSQPAE